MMSLKGLIAVAIILFITQQQSQSSEAKSLNFKYQVKFRRLPPKEFSAALGSSITIECEAGASPAPTIHWLKDGKRIYFNEMDANQLEDFDQLPATVDEGSRIALSATRSRLYIDCADVNDEATYTCVAENAYSRISSHTKLNLIRPAVQLASLSSQGAGASSAPTTGGVENDLSSLSELGIGGGGERVGGGADGDAGVGSQQQQRTDLQPLAAIPQCLSDRLTARSAPQAPVRIHMWTHNIVEIMKNNVIIYCRSNVNRQANKSQQQQQQLDRMTPTQTGSAMTPTIATSVNSKTSWTLPDDKLVNEDMRDKYEILETGDLLIKDLRWSDMGNYACTVSDERGSDTINSFVYPAAGNKATSKRSAAYGPAVSMDWQQMDNIR